MDKGQKMRYSDAEKSLIKRTFEDDKVLYALRNLFWDLELMDAEKSLLNFSPDQLDIIKKVMLPNIEREVPLGQQVDETHDPLLNQLSQLPPALGLPLIEANDVRLDYLEQQFEKLVSKEFESGPMTLAELKSRKGSDQDQIRHVNMLAYMSIKDYIDGRIAELQYFANPPVELTPEQKAEIARKDSTK